LYIIEKLSMNLRYTWSKNERIEQYTRKTIKNLLS